ncbi:nucleoside-triphosphate diphosphatase [Gallibacterium anatis str. Avicor]|uniref:XTP/dITP diphosphatase n=1 Tax=Gallibacterium anatis TaxID=750 RepID=UPI0005311EB8|nr:XTP/dITP diphosphatase [Gallibacterium anatis]KGQ56659.1 nucleoside-triphosphate diphosphatase [Gallibacterium anatis str. Avicor]
MKEKQKIILATGNQGKVNEMANVLAEFGFEVVAQTALGIESPEETGLTFVENALIKARHAAKISGLPAIADDSGLAVDYLNGQPGLYSARFAGEHASDEDNRAKLLRLLEGVPAEQRKAKFVSCIVLLRSADDPVPIIAQGECEGVITEQEIGENGFGYDALFFYADKQATFAQLSKEEKQQISHRARALIKLQQQLK